MLRLVRRDLGPPERVDGRVIVSRRRETDDAAVAEYGGAEAASVGRSIARWTAGHGKPHPLSPHKARIMQTRLAFCPSGSDVVKATTRPEQHLTRSGIPRRPRTPGFVARLACWVVLCASAVVSPALAGVPLAAGFETLQAADGTDTPLQVALWYPTEALAQPVDLGPFTLDIARGGAVAGRGLPLIVISHGNGGANLSHHDTAAALAQAGFVVAAVQHTGDNFADRSREASMVDRPRHVSRVIDHMLTTWSGRDRIDATRIGVFGHSSGGFTALVVVGGVADLGRIAPHCQQHAGEYACQLMARRPAAAAAVATAVVLPSRDARVRAAAVVAPALGFTFTQESLAAVSVPIQLWRAEDDAVLPHPWHAEAVRAALPQTLDHREVPQAGHFDFLAPCTPRFAAMAPPLCSSQPGFDRVAFHREFNAAVVGFFNVALKP
jgi:predicted dienelactone hydrolase